MQFHHKTPFARGYTPLVTRSGAAADMLMDFGVVTLLPGENWERSSRTDEQCLLLARGSAKITWQVNAAGPGPEHGDVSRPDLFDYSPWCLSVPRESKVFITAGKDGAEWYYAATDNPKKFRAKLFTPEECRSEFRGEGTMRETSTRIVRTCFDDTNRSESNLVIGEVIGVPGKWSSYPPHHHPQPEIYHYRFRPEQGFGLTAIGDTPYLIRDKDTILIREGQVHPQVTAPGYAMWYLWVIRHIDGAHYGPATHTPIFVEEHKWVMGDENSIWNPRR
ncbi:MAG: 5-deoxy-glucuronate isomerase [Spirochaetaceae bacterium]|jgi:5-deoxy-glucuronate isomerase|nr:5-deoxy-glucuronate isomerase [Spirochaetaceae bacterium]